MPIFKVQTSIDFSLQEKKQLVQDINKTIVENMLGTKIEDLKVFWYQTNNDSNFQIFSENNEEHVFYSTLEFLNTPQRTKIVRATCGKACMDIIMKATKKYTCTPVINVIPLEVYVKGNNVYYPNPPVEDNFLS